jgi:hypothetical protein
MYFRQRKKRGFTGNKQGIFEWKMSNGGFIAFKHLARTISPFPFDLLQNNRTEKVADSLQQNVSRLNNNNNI